MCRFSTSVRVAAVVFKKVPVLHFAVLLGIETVVLGWAYPSVYLNLIVTKRTKRSEKPHRFKILKIALYNI
jgi:hypothetical protein